MARALRLEFEDALYHLCARGQETVNFFAKYAPNAFTDEVNYVIDNEKQKALRVVGVRSARDCVTMPRAAN